MITVSSSNVNYHTKKKSNNIYKQKINNNVINCIKLYFLWNKTTKNPFVRSTFGSALRQSSENS